jgi:hypothetical protein
MYLEFAKEDNAGVNKFITHQDRRIKTGRR